MNFSDNNVHAKGKAKISNCPFCYENITTRIIAENNTVYAIKDSSPVTANHVLILPKRHCKDYFHLSKQECCDTDELVRALKESILKKDPAVTGFNIGMNCGVSAGQTVFHTHIHLIPRRDNDTPNPRGGVRGVIPDKMDY